jgi:hypothetical protein
MCSYSSNDELWQYFTDVVSPEIHKYQVKDESTKTNIGNLLDMASQQIEKVQVSKL